MRVLGWIMTTLSCLFLGLIIFLGRDSVITATMLVSKNAYLPRFIDKAYLIVFGLVWLVSWIFMEGYYSDGVKRHTLWRRFLQVTGIELVLLFAARILVVIYTDAGINWLGVALVTLSLIAGLGMIIYANRLNSTPGMGAQTHGARS